MEVRLAHLHWYPTQLVVMWLPPRRPPARAPRTSHSGTAALGVTINDTDQTLKESVVSPLERLAVDMVKTQNEEDTRDVKMAELEESPYTQSDVMTSEEGQALQWHKERVAELEDIVIQQLPPNDVLKYFPWSEGLPATERLTAEEEEEEVRLALGGISEV